MIACSSCSAKNPPTNNFCSACGASLRGVSADAALPTVGASGGARPADPPTSDKPISDGLAPGLTSDSLDEGRFIAGTLLVDRYRVIGRLGRGGMGEVYRANDLKLGQTVALKFLPERVGNDPDSLARFHNEVRLARQVSHPNICRVYDIGEVGGLHFITMEYVDGEDLASLLRRIGRLPADKALEIARQLCAGLAAAHDKGILHRDLKPANIMIDGRGKVLVTDFGLASIAGQGPSRDTSVGTPAYMAPEQIAGKEASLQSDIYSLGLVLYEIFTGKRAVVFRNLSSRRPVRAWTRDLRLPRRARRATTVRGRDPRGLIENENPPNLPLHSRRRR